MRGALCTLADCWGSVPLSKQGAKTLDLGPWRERDCESNEIIRNGNFHF